MADAKLPFSNKDELPYYPYQFEMDIVQFDLFQYIGKNISTEKAFIHLREAELKNDQIFLKVYLASCFLLDFNEFYNND